MTPAGRRFRLCAASALAIFSACEAPAPPDGSASTPTASAAAAAAPPSPARFTSGAAAERLRERAVGWALGAEDPNDRLSNAVVAFDALPEGHPREAALLEGLDVLVRTRPSGLYNLALTHASVRTAQRWVARGELRRARPIVEISAKHIAYAYGSDRDDLVALVDRIEGRTAAMALNARVDDGSKVDPAVARAEARFGDASWATAVAQSMPDVEACRIWNVLVVRHTRDGRDAAARDAWTHARSGARIGARPNHRAVDCLVDLSRAAASVGAGKDAAASFTRLPVDVVWPACTVLDQLARGFDPLLLDVPVAIVAKRRDEPGPPMPSCPNTAAWVAGRSGQGALARSLRSRAIFGDARLGGRVTDGSHQYLAEVASGDADPLEKPADQRFDPTWLTALIEMFDDHPERVIDEARFDARFPADRAPWTLDAR